jgi:hypothetical protein
MAATRTYSGGRGIKDFLLEVNRGTIKNMERWHMDGYNNDVGSSTEKLVVGGVFDIPTAEVTTIDIYSSDAEDGAGTSTGALTVRLTYLDTDYAVQTHDFTMNGTTKVTWTSADFFRFIWAHVLTTGSTNSNKGNIEITNANQSEKYGYIQALANQSLSGIYTVPANKTLYIDQASVSGGDYSDKITLNFWAECDGYNHSKIANQFYKFHIVELDGNTASVEFGFLAIPEKTTIYITVVAVTGAEQASCRMTGVLVDDQI